MNAKPWAVVGVLLLGAILGGYVVDATGQPMPIPAYQFPVDSLPPHPSQIATASADWPLPLGPTPPVDHIAYTVPIDRWFVVTDIYRSGGGEFEFVEVIGTNSDVKISLGLNGGAHFNISKRGPNPGIVFRPGSQVVFRYQGGGNPGDRLTYYFGGYLVR